MTLLNQIQERRARVGMRLHESDSGLSANEGRTIIIMFASHEKNVAKKTFQKPNILRRKGIVSAQKVNISNVKESPEAISLVTTTHMEKSNISDQLDNITILEGSNKSSNVKKTVWELTLAKHCEDKHYNILKSQETEKHANLNSNTPIPEIKNPLNIESFINSSGSIEQDLSIPCDATVSTEKKTTQAKKWCFDITNNPMDVIINNYKEEQLGDLEEKLDSVIVVPSDTLSDEVPEQVHNQVPTGTTPTQTIAVNCYSNRAVKFKCDQPNCNKGFWSEEKLRKHKNSHKRQMYRTPTQIKHECPVKKKAEDGSEEKCPRTYEVRGELLKHLDEDHTLDEAQHSFPEIKGLDRRADNKVFVRQQSGFRIFLLRCTVCGRRFFWAMGLRAHGSSLCARGGLVCGWPGCGRVFRLPCRLREHARAHTGDRPYLCRFPDCGWAFRSASKLVRHARRHTDERQHACTTCGRAFMRREHLRDHCARHHQPSTRTTHLCTHPGCEQSFTNMSTLYMHMKKVHRKVEKVPVTSVAKDSPTTASVDGGYVYLVSLPDDVVVEEDESTKEVSSASAELEGEHSGAANVAGAGSEGGAGRARSAVGAGGEGSVGDEEAADGEGGAGGVEWHAARTHCTWPLPRPAHTHYVLDDDVHVERTEGSVSDVYTVRSDLFLHGNVPIDDDSQQIVGAALSGEASALDADLCLINAHPTIDLMQEELMYEDAADESSFRVFLMNGEELT